LRITRLVNAIYDVVRCHKHKQHKLVFLEITYSKVTKADEFVMSGHKQVDPLRTCSREITPCHACVRPKRKSTLHVEDQLWPDIYYLWLAPNLAMLNILFLHG
jgi:hypothetical protein